jgi:hypothetical protein
LGGVVVATVFTAIAATAASAVFTATTTASMSITTVFVATTLVIERTCRCGRHRGAFASKKAL